MSGLLFIIRRMVKSADRRGELADVTSVLCRTYCLIKAQTVDEGVPAAEREYGCSVGSAVTFSEDIHCWYISTCHSLRRFAGNRDAGGKSLRGGGTAKSPAGGGFRAVT